MNLAPARLLIAGAAVGIVSIQTALSIEPDLVRGMPAAYLNKEDLGLVKDAVRVVAEHESDAASQSWTNPKTGHSGKVSALRASTDAKGRPCKLIQIDNQAGGHSGSSRYNLCRDTDGVWRDADSGAPFTGSDAGADEGK